MNENNYGTIPYYDFLSNQQQVCIILILSITCIIFTTSIINSTAAHQKNADLPTESTITNSLFPYIPAVCGGTTTQKACGNSMVLTADPGQSNYLWSTGETTPSISVNASATYWWETIDMVNNKVANGDFSAGNAGFTSAYSYKAPGCNNCGSYGALSAEKTYSVATDPKLTHTNFKSFPDHTGNISGVRNMMIVNGSSVANTTIWTETINIQPNTDYIFSVWFTSVYPDNPGKLNFSINGAALGNPILLTSGTPDWKNFTVRWTSTDPLATTATIGIVNQNTSTSGNDFALDDIVFAPVCRNSIVATLNPNPTKPSITPL